MLKTVGVWVLVSVISVASFNATADESAKVKVIATGQNINIALGDMLALQSPHEILRKKEVSQDEKSHDAQLGLVEKAPQKAPEHRGLLASLWLLGAALSLFVLRASRRKV